MPDIESLRRDRRTISTSRCASTPAACRCGWPSAWPPRARPDVLIVDEALSVGDAYFQHKSFDRIRAFREQGTTLLLVSHDKSAIQSICDEAILLDAGRLAMHGEPEAVMDYYNAMIAEKENSTVRQAPSKTAASRRSPAPAKPPCIHPAAGRGRRPVEVVGRRAVTLLDAGRPSTRHGPAGAGLHDQGPPGQVYSAPTPISSGISCRTSCTARQSSTASPSR